MGSPNSNPSEGAPDNRPVPAIRLDGVSKSFGFRDVLKSVNLEVPQGECLAVYGHNGAGKTTLARIVSTQWAPSSGSGSILGYAIGRENTEIRSRAGIVGDQSYLRTELSLDENLQLFGALYGTRDVDFTGELLDRFGLVNRKNDSVSTYSKGMTKRANLIRSLLHRPDLWVLDEPFSGLDQDGQVLLGECIKDFIADGKTVLLVTHQRDIGEGLATASIEIQNGCVVKRSGLGEAGSG
jgi:heme exporter protein A